MATWIWVNIGSDNGLLWHQAIIRTKCWLLISVGFCDIHLLESNFTASAEVNILYNEFENYTL